MFTDRVEYTTQIDQSWTIELERSNSRSAYRCQAQHQSEILVPGKMFIPALLTGMKQENRRVSDRIGSRGPIGLVLVAAMTAESQVLSCCQPAKAARHNVINGEGI